MVAEGRCRLSLDGKPFTDTLKSAAGEVEDNFTRSILQAGQAITAAFTVQRIVAFAREAMRAADEIDNLSKRLDIGRESVQSLGVVAKDSGLSMSDFEQAITRTQRSAVEARAGSDSLRKAFEQLGLSVEDLAGMSTEEIFDRVTQAMAANRHDAETLSAAYDIIGTRAGPRLTSELIKLGELGFEALNEKMRNSKRIMDDDVTGSLNDLEHHLTVLTDRVTTLGKTVLGQVAGDINRKISIISILYDALSDRIRGTGDEVVRVAKEEKEIAEARKKEEEKQLLEMQRREDYAARIARAQEAYNAELEKTSPKVRTLADIENEIREAKLDTIWMKNVEGDHADRILDRQSEILRLERERGELEAARMAELQNAEQELERARAGYNAEVYKSLDLGNKIAIKHQELAAATDDIVKLEAEGLANTKEWYEAKRHLLQITGEIDGLTKQLSMSTRSVGDGVDRVVNAWEGLNDEKVKSLVDLREAMKGMADGEIDEFLAAIKHLAKELSEMPSPDLEWVSHLQRIDQSLRSSEFIKAQAEKYGQALAALAKAIEDVPAPDTSWINNLRRIDQIIRMGMGGVENAQKYGQALAKIAEALSQFGPIDASWLDILDKMDWAKLGRIDLGGASGQIAGLAEAVAKLSGQDLEEAMRFLEILSDLEGGGGNYVLDLQLPEGFESGVPLIMPDGMDGNLNSIAASLETLAGLKGVIFA